jgi:hypothetical protein
VKRLIVLAILSLSSIGALSQIPSGLDLDDNWSTWTLTQDQDPHVSAPTYWKWVFYRWRRTSKPAYRCEVEFRNPGTVARDFKFEISYQDNVPPLFQHHKYTGTLLAVADAPRQVTIAGRPTACDAHRFLLIRACGHSFRVVLLSRARLCDPRATSIAAWRSRISIWTLPECLRGAHGLRFRRAIQS